MKTVELFDGYLSIEPIREIRTLDTTNIFHVYEIEVHKPIQITNVHTLEPIKYILINADNQINEAYFYEYDERIINCSIEQETFLEPICFDCCVNGEKYENMQLTLQICFLGLYYSYMQDLPKGAIDFLKQHFASITKTEPEIDELPREVLRHIKAKQHTFLNDNVNNQLRSIPANTQYRVKQNKDGSETCIVLDFVGEIGKISAFDKTVLNAVASEYSAGSNYFTLQGIHRLLNGGTGKRATKKQLENYQKAINKLWGTFITMDLGSDCIKFPSGVDEEEIKKTIATCQKRTHLLNLEEDTVILRNGQKATCYRFLSEPILLQYNRVKDHIVHIPIKFFDTPSVCTSEEIVVIREYLLQQLYMLKSKERHNNTFLFSTIYEKAGIEEPTERMQKKRDRDNICKMLDDWIEHGLLTSYSLVKENNAITKFTVEIAE